MRSSTRLLAAGLLFAHSASLTFITPQFGSATHLMHYKVQWGRARKMKGDEFAGKFPLGRTVITSNAECTLDPEDVFIGITRHASGDWGDCCEDDVAENELSLREGFRLLSVYRDRSGTKFWIITEADRSVTTVLLPEDY